MVSHNGVLPKGRFPVDSLADAVLGHISDVAQPVFPAAQMGDVPSVKGHLPLAAFPEPEQAFHQFLLAGACDACDSKYLTFPDFK